MSFIFLFISIATFGQSVVKDSILFDSLKTIDMQIIKNQPYMKLSKLINCDSISGTSAEHRICANLELQKQDSLLQIELKALINEMGNDSTAIKKIILSQEIWERYRYAQCNNCVIDETSFDMIIFMNCASELTKQRRIEIEKICIY